MSAADEDTELRDLLIHTLESNGVLSKIKAELRASVFLALEEQERTDSSKPRLLNERLRHFLSSREGRLAAGLVTDFLQCFHLDFTLAVLQPEASLQLEERAHVAQELGLPAKSGPLLQELISQRDAAPDHIARARDAFDRYDWGKTGEIGREDLRDLLMDLMPGFPRSMLEAYIAEEHPAGGGIRLQPFLAMYRRLVALCRAVGDPNPDIRADSPSEQIGSASQSPPMNALTGAKLPDTHQIQEEEEEGDSFFDDPIPRPEKAYGWREEDSKPNSSLAALLQKSQSSNHNEDSQRSSLRDPRSTSEKMASLHLGAAPEEDYADDFHSTSQRSDKSEVSIGEDLEEDLSVDDLTGSDHKLEDFTLDNSISHISDVADYLEDIS
ncbi:centrosomal protein 43 [Gastrophryne carolinensis]